MTTVATPPSAPTPADATPAVTIKRVGIAAAVVAGIAWILTLPPITARSAVPSIVLGLLAAAVGIVVALNPKHRRLRGARRSAPD